MKTPFLLVALGTTLLLKVSFAADLDRIRSLLQLPSVSVGVAYPSAAAFRTPRNQEALRKQLAAIASGLNGTRSDVERYVQLLDGYRVLNDPQSQLITATNAVKLLRKLRETEPHLANEAALLSQVLKNVDDPSAAGLAREAIKLDAKCWQGWCALAVQLHDDAWTDLVQHLDPAFRTNSSDVLSPLLANKPPAHKIASARAKAEEAMEAVNHAVEIAPDEIELRHLRPDIRLVASMIQLLEEPPTHSLPHPFTKAIDPENITDWLHIVRIQPEDIPTYLELVVAAQVATPSATKRELQTALQRGIERVEPIAFGDVSEASVSALVFYGMAQLQFFQDIPAAERAGLRLTEIAPQQNAGWDMLTMIYVSLGKFPPLVSLLKARLQVSDTIPNRISLAKAYEKAGDLEAAEEQVNAALSLERDSCLANLSKGTLRLKRARSVEESMRVQVYLKKIAGGACPNLSEPLRTEVSIFSTAYLILVEELEQARRVMSLIDGLPPSLEAIRKNRELIQVLRQAVN